MRVRSAVLFGLTLLASACASQPPDLGPVQSLEAVVAGPQRSAENKARDRYRHPVETLEYFGIQPDMTVVEVWPGGGWYTEILAPYLRPEGHYVAAGFVIKNGDDSFYARSGRAFKQKLAAQPQVYSQATVSELGAPSSWTPVPAGTADMVLTFRNVHNWLKAGTEREMFASFYRSLKHGGVLGVVEHRANPGTSREEMIASGYVTQDLVVQLAKDAGFVFAGWQEINANPKDTKNYPGGVWTLPPTLRLGDQDRQKYLSIGESDRMTLKFIKS